ncbi:PTS sugar transporter subunit IIB [Robertmurraya sp. GLU-23]|jgi:galactitol PTS system EIIB component
MKKKTILVACGAGIATSTVVNEAILEMCSANNIQANLVQCKITEVSGYLDSADLLVTTTITGKDYPFPVINARAFLTGIGLDDVKQQILEEIKK